MEREVNWLLQEKYRGEKTEAFFADCERLASGEPLAYLIGHIPFLGATIHLDSKPLIPRPETEYWVEKVIHEIRTRSDTSSMRVLDLCAGSGCIGIALLLAYPEIHTDFVEINKHHHLDIVKNIQVNEIDPGHVNVVGGDLFEQTNSQYDYILSNPPYINPKKDRAEESVKKFEPKEALYGGDGGIEIIKRIIENAPARLKTSGTLYLEHEPEQTEPITTLGHAHGFEVSTHTDQFGIQRYSRLCSKNVAE